MAKYRDGRTDLTPELDRDRPVILQVKTDGKAVYIRFGEQVLGCDPETAEELAQELVRIVMAIRSGVLPE